MSPASGNSQPATGVFVELAVAIPGQLHLDPTVFVAMDFAVLRPGDDGRLIAEHPWLFRPQGWTKEHVPRRREKGITVTTEFFPIAGHRFLQHLRLPTTVFDGGEQPQIIPYLTRMPGQLQEMSTSQCGFIADAFGLTVIGDMALKCTLGEVLAGFTVVELAGKAVILKHRGLFAVDATLQLQARLLEIVVAPGDHTGTGLHANIEALNRRRPACHASARQIKGRLGQAREHRLIVAEHQQVAFGTVLKMVVNADFGAQALDKREITLCVLHAIFAHRVFAAEAKFEGVAQDCVVLEHLRNDLRHALVLKYPLIDAVPEVRQTRDKAQVITSKTFPGIALSDLIDLTVNTGTIRIKAQKRLTVQQAFELQVRPLTDQFQLETKGLADGFRARELKDFEVVRGAFEGQRETRLIGRREHPMSLCK